MTHQHVDVATLVEICTPQGPFAIPHVLRDADVRAVPEFTAGLRQVKSDPSASFSGGWLDRAGSAAARIPCTLPAMYAVLARSVAARQHVGTIAVTSVGGQVTIRDILDLTLAIDHNVVDGAPAARFGAEVRALLESAAVISPEN